MSNGSGNTFVQTPLFIDFLKNSKDEIVLYVDPPLIIEMEWKIFMKNLFNDSKHRS